MKLRTGFSNAGAVPDDLMDAVNKQVEEGSPLGVTDDVFESRMEWVADEWEVDLPNGCQRRRNTWWFSVR